MSNRNFLLKGTLLLTLSGFLTKIIGFIYRIFLSQKIGAQGMGIYQLIFPFYTLCYALAVGGIQTAISRLVAAKAALKDEQGARDVFLLSATLAATISILTGFFLYRHANWFAVHLILADRCCSVQPQAAASVPGLQTPDEDIRWWYSLERASGWDNPEDFPWKEAICPW